MIQPYPLQWPIERARTRTPEPARTAVSLAAARDHLLKQMELLGAKIVVISSNAALRKDGLPMAKQPKVADVGVAVWFKWTILDYWLCISCDLNDSIAGNIRAIGLSISEMRGFTGRLALPLQALIGGLFLCQPPTQKPPPKQEQKQKAPPPKPPKDRNPSDWRSILKLGGVVTWTQVQANYRNLAKVHHPDKGGKVEDFQRIQNAYEQAKKYFNFK